jgi:uncharacterized damage-inducible protein DinB
MSTTTNPNLMDTKTICVRGLKRACEMYMQDLEALPADSYTKKFGGKARTIADFTYETILVNDHIGMVIRGEEPFKWPEGGYIFAPEDFDTKEKVMAAFQKSCDKIIATFEAFSTEELEETITTEDGETTRFERCRFMMLHLWYHFGQLNFIQTLLGDDGWHWH